MPPRRRRYGRPFSQRLDSAPFPPIIISRRPRPLMPTLLTCTNLCKSFGSTLLFSDISISFADDERIGMIGPNGAGKSTFLKILAGLEHYDSGEITSKRNLRLEYVPQDETFSPGQTIEPV